VTIRAISPNIDTSGCESVKLLFKNQFHSYGAGETIRIRFHYYDAHYAWWWAISDVQVTCSTAGEVPYNRIYLLPVLRHYP
jgi:hypothetical protein